MIKLLLRDLYMTEALLGMAVAFFMWRAKRLSNFPSVVAWLAANTVTVSLLVVLIFFRNFTHLSKMATYDAYFTIGWISFMVSSCMQLVIIYNIFNEAMAPFEGLRKIGRLIFAWGGVVSIAMAIAFCAGPEMFTPTFSRDTAMLHIAAHLQQCISILTVCLLVFVAFAARPLGLNFRSRLFGVTLGLGIMATTDLITAAWYAIVNDHSVYSPVNLASVIGYCVTLLVWGTYFALPEPEARLILLPTTSPFFHWNRISEILGDAPGQVAVAGLTPEMLAPAEIAMMEAALPSRQLPEHAGLNAYSTIEAQLL